MQKDTSDPFYLLAELNKSMLEPEASIIFGGTFDPVHQGHLGVIRKLITDFESVLLAVTLANPFKTTAATAWEHRIEMLRLALLKQGMLDRVEILNLQYTYAEEVIRYLRDDRRFSGPLWWAVGEDIAEEVVNWKNWDALDIRIAVARIDPQIHASDIRSAKAAPLEELKEYIRAHKLYEA